MRRLRACTAQNLQVDGSMKDGLRTASGFSLAHTSGRAQFRQIASHLHRRARSASSGSVQRQTTVSSYSIPRNGNAPTPECILAFHPSGRSQALSATPVLSTHATAETLARTSSAAIQSRHDAPHSALCTGSCRAFLCSCTVNSCGHSQITRIRSGLRRLRSRRDEFSGLRRHAWPRLCHTR